MVETQGLTAEQRLYSVKLADVTSVESNGSTMIRGPKTDLRLNPRDPEKKQGGEKTFLNIL